MTRIPVLNDAVMFYPGHEKPPVKAVIEYVWSPSCVNLRCADGSTPTSVFLAQAYDHNRPAGYYCEFLPQAPTLDTDSVPAYQGRVVAERMMLDAQIERLRQFMLTDTYRALDAGEHNRLHAQLSTMLRYSEILGERIAAFKLKEN